MLTESRNPRTMDIDQLPALEILRRINDEDAAVAAVVRDALPQIAHAVETITARLRDGGRLIYAGAGTSGRLAMLDAVECVPTFSTAPEQVQALVAGGAWALTHAVEGAEDDRAAGRADLLALNPTRQDAVVGIAASGRTPYVIAVLEAAAEVGAATIAVSCNVPAPMLDIAEIGIAAVVGPEVVTGSTRLKAGTAQKLILNMLSTATMIQLGKVYGNLMVDVMVTNAKLAERACRIVAEVTGLSLEDAAAVLEQSDRQVKVAIVTALLGISPQEARLRLAQENGLLARVIQPRQG